MAQLLPNGRQQFLDANGNPLVGGLVYFYIPNTTTPKDTWQDSAKSALNTNPVACDARGQATIYGDGDYRQVLQDAQGNQIWDKSVSAPVPPFVFEQGSEPTTDQGDIWINGIGICSWDTALNKYMRAPGIYLYRKQITTSGSITFDAYTQTIRYSGCGGGGGGGKGSSNSAATATGSGGGGGGGAVYALGVILAVTPGATYPIAIGAGGAGSVTYTLPGADGGTTTLGALVSLQGGGGGYAGTYSGSTNNARGGESSNPVGGQPGSGGQDSGSASYGSGGGGTGGGSPFGSGGTPGCGRYNGSQDGNRAVHGKGGYGYGAGGGGGGGAYAADGVTTVEGGNGGNGVGGILIIEY